MSQKSGFRATLSDCSKTSLKNQKKKKIKDQDCCRRNFLRDSAPQIPKINRLDPFFIFSYSQKNSKIFALVLFDIWNFLVVSLYFVWFYLTNFYHFLLCFLVVFKFKIQNSVWMFSDFIIRNPIDIFENFIGRARIDRVGKVISTNFLQVFSKAHK